MGQPKEKRENEWISRGQPGGRAGQHKEKRENKMISRAKTGGGWANLRKKENINEFVGAKNRARGRPLKEKRENK